MRPLWCRVDDRLGYLHRLGGHLRQVLGPALMLMTWTITAVITMIAALSYRRTGRP